MADHEGSPGAAAGTQVSRERYSYARSLIEASLDPLVTIDRDGRITDVNRATEEATGVDRARLIGSDFSDYFTEPEHARAGYQQVWRDGAVVDYPLALRHASGRVIDVLYNASLYRDGAGQVRGIFAAARDITERKRAEEAVRLQSYKNEMLLKAASDGIVIVDKDGRVLQANDAFCQLIGYSHEELARLRITDFDALFDADEVARRIADLLHTPRLFETRHRRKDGRIIDVEVNAIGVEVGGDTLLYSAIRDITERKRTEEALRTASLYARSLLEASLDPLVTIDREGRITDVNRATEEATGVDRVRLIGSDFSDYFTEPGRARAGYLQVWRDGAVVDYPLALRHASGRVIDVLYNASLYRDEAGQVRGIFAAARDISERKRAEEDLRRAHAELEQRVRERTEQLATANAALQADIDARKQAEEALRRLNETLGQRIAEEVAKNREKDMVLIQQSRLAAMGEMIGNIAHQWRQPLNALGLVLANVKDAFDYGELTGEYLERTLAQGERLIQNMSTTINDFRDFFLPDKERKAFSALEQVRETLSLVEASFRNHNVAIRLEIESDPLLLGFPNEFSQVLLNLLGNAKDAIGATGRSGGQVRIRLGADGGMGRVTVADDGGGIPPDILGKIFEPYFSTKKMGTGIGLYMTKMIVERNMGGSVTARNLEGGAEFAIRIPLAEPGRPPEIDDAAPPA